MWPIPLRSQTPLPMPGSCLLYTSGAYLAAVIRCGSALRRLLDRHRRLPEYHGVTCMADLTLGCSLLITVFCLMSLAGIGSIGNTRLAVLVLLALSFFPAVSGSEARARARAGYGGFWRERKPMTVAVSYTHLRLLGSMQSPIANFARVINQIAEKNGGSAEA